MQHIAEPFIDDRQLAALIGWPVEVVRAHLKAGIPPRPHASYRGTPLWLARLVQPTAAETVRP